MRPLGLVGLAAAGAFTLAGCDPRTLAYFFGDGQPQIPGQAPSFEGKKIAVVTTAAPTALADFQTIDRDLNRELVSIFRDRAEEGRDHRLQEGVRLGRGAPDLVRRRARSPRRSRSTYVVYFEIQGFSIRDPRSPGLLEGNAEVNFRVTEYAHPKKENGKPNTAAPKESNQVYEDATKTTFPKNAPIAIETGVSRSSFKAKFLKLVANEISWQFLGHNPGDEIAPDQRF